MSTQHEQLIRSANQRLLADGDVSAIPQFFAAEYAVHAGDQTHRGHAFVDKFIGMLRESLSDLRVIGVDILSEAGDVIAWQRTLEGTHRAALSGIPPSGKTVRWREMLVSRFDEHGRIAEEWIVSEFAGSMMARL